MIEVEIAYLAVEATPFDDPLTREETVPDERLRLMFTCCHPALDLEAQAVEGGNSVTIFVRSL